MRFQVIAEVIGEAYAEEAVAASQDGIDIELRVEPSSHRVTHVALTVPANEILASLRGRARPSGPTPVFLVPPAPRLEDLRALLQYLESVGSFWLSCERINWGEPEFHWIAETDEESELLDLFTFSIRREYEPNRVRVTNHLLEYLLGSRPTLSRYTVPLAFYREGEREHKAKRYLYSFFNYYFFLEDLFAEGQFKTRAVEQALLGSAQLRRAVEFTLERLGGDNRANHLAALWRLGQRVGCEVSPEGAIRLIVQMRGDLHHFSSSSPRPKGHPLNQEEYESLSVLIGGICVAVVADLMPGGGPGATDDVCPGR